MNYHRCPQCKSDLIDEKGWLVCEKCETKYVPALLQSFWEGWEAREKENEQR